MEVTSSVLVQLSGFIGLLGGWASPAVVVLDRLACILVDRTLVAVPVDALVSIDLG